jgi:hypothetical protein
VIVANIKDLGYSLSQGIFESWRSKKSSIESAKSLNEYSTSHDLQRRLTRCHDFWITSRPLQAGQQGKCFFMNYLLNAFVCLKFWNAD